MIELGAILGNISQKIKGTVDLWLADQVDIYNKLHDYNTNKTALFPSDPLGLKCFVPTSMHAVSPPHGSNLTCNILDSDSVMFYSSGILNTYTISTETFSDDITPDDAFSYHYSLNSNMFEISTGYAWITNKTALDGSSLAEFSVQHTADNFATITTIAEHSFVSPANYRFFTAVQDSDDIVCTYVGPYLSSSTYDSPFFVDVTYDIGAGTSSLGSQEEHSFSLWYNSSPEYIQITKDTTLVKKFGDYILVYGSYGYRTGFFLIDRTKTDTYWYYFDPVFFNMYRDVYTDEVVSNKIYNYIKDIKKIGSDFYFVFDPRSYTSGSTDYPIIICKMETV